VDLLHTPEQEQIAEAARRYLATELPLHRLRDPRRTDAAALPTLAGLGWLSLGLDEAAGGGGGSLLEEQIVMREAGRALLSPVLLATCLAAKIAAGSGDARLASQFAGGERTAGFAIPVVATELAEPQGEFLLVDGRLASHWLIWTASGLSLLTHAVWEQRAAHGLDNSLLISRASLVSFRVASVVEKEAPVVDAANLLVAAMMLGMSRAALEMAVDYVKLREQFGQPIGSFQAVKHRCADSLVRSEAAQALVDFASVCVANGQADAAFQARAARIAASKAGFANAAANIQLHGAMGFTAACDAHWFQKRMHVLDQLGGARRAQETALLVLSAV